MKSILIVEDDDDVRELIGCALKTEGYDVILARNGLEALEKASGTVGLIFLDLMMPVLDGWQFLEAQQKDQDLARIPVCLFSASKREAHSPSVVQYLHKPIELDSLLEVAQNHISPQS